MGSKETVEKQLKALKDVHATVASKQPEVDALLPQLPESKAGALSNQWTALTTSVREALGDLEATLEICNAFSDRHTDFEYWMEKVEGRVAAVSKMKQGKKKQETLKVCYLEA